MTRNILAMIGLATVLLGLAIWNLGFFSAKIEDVTSQLERETAVARAQAMIRDTERRAADLTDKARELRISARAKQIAAEREAEQLQKMRMAIDGLAAAARETGMSKPSEATEDDRKTELSFAGRILSGDDVYRTLERWQIELRHEERKNEVTQKMIERMGDASNLMEAKQETMNDAVDKVRSKLEELQMHRDLARVEKEVAELGANVRGEFAGDLGKAMETLQKEIDELQATADVLGRRPAPGISLRPDEVLARGAGELTAREDLDALWDNPTDRTSNDR